MKARRERECCLPDVDVFFYVAYTLPLPRYRSFLALNTDLIAGYAAKTLRCAECDSAHSARDAI